ncbi:MAG: acetyl-CoA carboxylase carboxyltransferase subunit beta [Planctomycetes bacterium]|nr:acetyl-CoA carboxylase carboxyltransferase subunit beta [Planctomycetota bacterium]
MAWTRFGKKKDMPGGLWIKCESCGAMLFRKEFEQRNRVCGTCGYHFTLPARDRIAITADAGSFEEMWINLQAQDLLSFNDRVPYGEKLVQTRLKTGEHDAMVTGTCTVKGIPCAIGVMNFQFLGGSMGMVVGEKIALLCEMAAEKNLPVILFACSGGARMHEGAVSLMQMAKTCGALTKLNQKGVVSISVMTHPTTGGVTASFASVCDLLIAEPGALIGFAGPRVIATTIKKELPKGFQRSEFLLEKGQIDRIVPRAQMRDELARLLAYATGRDPVAAYKPLPVPVEAEVVAATAAVEAEPEAKPKKKAKQKKDA